MNKTLTKQQPPSWSRHIAILVILAVIPAIIYSNSFQVPFIFDDIPNIVQKAEMQMSVITPSSLHKTTFEGANSRRWLPNLSLGLNYYFGGHEVWGYHLVNLVVHIMTTIVLYGLFFTTLTLPRLNFSQRRAAEISLISALIWAVHPLQTNAVTYIVQRMSSMAAFFYLASLLLYVRSRLQDCSKTSIIRYAFWAASSVCGLLSLVCKENSAMLPLIILAYEFYFLSDRNKLINYRKSIAVLCVSLLGIFAISWFYIGSSSLDWLVNGYMRRDFTLVERLLTETRIIVHYLSLIVLPLPSRLNLAYDYDISCSLFSPPLTLIATLGIVFLTGMTVYLFKRHRLLSFGLLWFLGNLLIESTIIPLELVFEHRLYLPSSMLILSVVVLIYGLWGMRQQVLPLLWTGVIIVLCLFTWQRNEIWGSGISFWQDAVNKNPESTRGFDQLGGAHYHEENFEKAAEYYKKAVFFDPSAYKSYDNLGRAYLNKGLVDESIIAHKKAIQIKPTFSKAYANLGLAYFKKGQIDESIKAFQKAIKIKPSYATANFNLGVIYLIKGRVDESIKVLEKATQINPSYPKAYSKLGQAYFKNGQIDESIKAYQEVIAINPSSFETHTKLGIIYRNKGRIDESINVLLKAIQINPSYSRAYFNLGVAYFNKGLIDESIKGFLKAIQINPSYSSAYFNLGVVYFNKGLLDKSIEAYKMAIKINPSYSQARANLRSATLKRDSLGMRESTM